jgi:hypothetical protein
MKGVAAETSGSGVVFYRVYFDGLYNSEELHHPQACIRATVYTNGGVVLTYFYLSIPPEVTLVPSGGGWWKLPSLDKLFTTKQELIEAMLATFAHDQEDQQTILEELI